MISVDFDKFVVCSTPLMIDSDKRSIVLLGKFRFMTILRMFMVLRILVNSGSVGAITYVFYSDRSVRISLLLISSFLFDSL